MRVGHISVSSQPALRMVMLGALSLAAVGNLAAGLILVKNARVQTLCWTWALAFAALFCVEYLTFSGQIQFDWLKRFLRWLQQKIEA